MSLVAIKLSDKRTSWKKALGLVLGLRVFQDGFFHFDFFFWRPFFWDPKTAVTFIRRTL